MWGEGGRSPSNGGTALFQGTSLLNLDAKGRLAIPSKYRGVLAETSASRVVVTANPQGGCLLLYPQNEWDVIARKVVALPSFVPHNRNLQRILLGSAADLEMDGQGRILLPENLRKYAGLEKKVAILGQGNKFEIWDDAAWAGEFDALVASANDFRSELSVGLAELQL